MQTNSLIQKMLGTAAPEVAAPESAEQSEPTLQTIATNGKLLVENLSQLAQIVEGWSQ